MEKIDLHLNNMYQKESWSMHKEVERGYQNTISMKDNNIEIYHNKEDLNKEESKRKAREIAREMRMLGYKITDIALITELSKKEIEKL